jgi:polysaccharide pyruvyl transferase CsaB
MSLILLAGYFGSGNLGDDAILLGYLHALERVSSGHEYIVMAGSPDMMQRVHNLRAIDRRDMRAFQSSLESSDALVFPGGSIFQDVTSQRSAFYYHDLIKRAKKAGKRVLLLGQGVGPLNGFFGKRLSAEAFQLADTVSVRDPGSLATLQSLKVKRPVKVTADCAFLLPLPADTEEAQTYQVAGRTTVGVVARPWGKGKTTAEFFAGFCRLLFEHEMMPVLIEMDSVMDAPFIDEIEKLYGGRISHIRKLNSPITVLQRLSRMDGLVSMRLHGGILGAAVGLSPFMVSYDPKTSAFARQLGFDNPPNVEGLNPKRLLDLFLEHQRLRERYKATVARNVSEQRKAAEGNIELTLETLGLAPKP